MLKKTRTELKEMVVGWMDNSLEFLKKQEPWKILAGGVVFGVILVLLIGIILPLLFLTVVACAVIYFMSPVETNTVDSTGYTVKDDDDKTNKNE